MTRPDLYVVARLIERLYREEGPMLKTRLQIACGVNYDVFTKYLEWMLHRELVSLVPEDGHELVSITAEGEETYRKLVRWINEFIAGR
jgi:predicted transcriptional regulator